VSFGQRRHLDRVIEDECRLDELGLNAGAEDLIDDRTPSGARRELVATKGRPTGKPPESSAGPAIEVNPN
jgi:hypothetical protein